MRTPFRQTHANFGEEWQESCVCVFLAWTMTTTKKTSNKISNKIIMMKDVIKRFQKRTGKKYETIEIYAGPLQQYKHIANGIRGHTHIHMHVLIIINVAVVVTVTALAVPTNECFYCSWCSYVAHEQTCYLIESICFFYSKKNLMIFCQKKTCACNKIGMSPKCSEFVWKPVSKVKNR